MVATPVTIKLYVAAGLVVGFVLGYWQRRVVHDHNFQNYDEDLVICTPQRHFKSLKNFHYAPAKQ
jgi:hypothetical protein